MRCPTCGTENAPDSRFCGGCGARLEPARVAPTFKIPDDAAYPDPAIGHLPTPTPGSLQMPQPRVGSIPPTNPALAIKSVPPMARPASVPPVDRPVSVPPADRPASRPPTSAAPAPSISMPAARRRGGALIAVVVIADLGLAAAGGALLFKGLQKAKPAAWKSEGPVVTPLPTEAAEVKNP